MTTVTSGFAWKTSEWALTPDTFDVTHDDAVVTCGPAVPARGGYANDGFLVNTDPKWVTHPDPKATPKEQWMNDPGTRELYCLGLCHRKDVRSLRDLSPRRATR